MFCRDLSTFVPKHSYKIIKSTKKNIIKNKISKQLESNKFSVLFESYFPTAVPPKSQKIPQT